MNQRAPTPLAAEGADPDVWGCYGSGFDSRTGGFARVLLRAHGEEKVFTKAEVLAALSAITDPTLVREEGYRQGIEDAAKVTESLKTCGCEGSHGRCLEDDPYDYAAEAIRSLASKEQG